MTMNWEKFDWEKPMDDLFWAVVEREEFDFDVADDGVLIRGEATGEVSRHVELVWIVNVPDQPDYNGPEIEPVDLGNVETYKDSDSIVLIAPFTMPECPVPTKEKVEP